MASILHTVFVFTPRPSLAQGSFLAFVLCRTDIGFCNPPPSLSPAFMSVGCALSARQLWTVPAAAILLYCVLHVIWNSSTLACSAICTTPACKCHPYTALLLPKLSPCTAALHMWYLYYTTPLCMEIGVA